MRLRGAMGKSRGRMGSSSELDEEDEECGESSSEASIRALLRLVWGWFDVGLVEKAWLKRWTLGLFIMDRIRRV